MLLFFIIRYLGESRSLGIFRSYLADLGLANLGATFLFKKWAFPLTLSLPVINEMNGLQNDFGYRFRVGVIRAF